MDILFITSTHQLKLNYISNGTMILGTLLLNAGFDVNILRFAEIEDNNKNYANFINNITSKIIASNPKCISFYTLWPFYHVILRIAKEVRKRNKDIIIILGGPQSSATAQQTMENFDCIDYICTGEGENTVIPFFSSLLKNNKSFIENIPGLYYRKNNEILHNNTEIPLCDLNKLPHWDDRLLSAWNPLDEKDIRSSEYFMPIDAGRGCPFSCTFCSTSKFWRRTYRLKSAERIVEDIEYMQKKYGINSFFFTHDAFTVNKKLVSSVCDLIIEKKLKISWRCTTRIDCLNEDLLAKMVKAGLKFIEVGIETGSQRMQKIINKNLDLQYAKEMIKITQKYNICTVLFFIYGFPEETENDINDTLNFIFDCLDIGVNRANLNFLRFSPATRQTIEYYDQLILDPDSNKLSHGFFGYEEEIEMIANNKYLSTSFYNLKTAVRSDYEHLYFFEKLYENHKVSMSYLRRFYNGDCISFYKDVVTANYEYFHNFSSLKQNIYHYGTELIRNLIHYKNFNFTPQGKDLIAFAEDIEFINQSEPGVTIKKFYNFNYLDYLEDISLIDSSAFKSELLIQKIDGKTITQLIDIQPV